MPLLVVSELPFAEFSNEQIRERKTLKDIEYRDRKGVKVTMEEREELVNLKQWLKDNEWKKKYNHVRPPDLVQTDYLPEGLEEEERKDDL